jgi:hypothetical protein
MPKSKGTENRRKRRHDESGGALVQDSGNDAHGAGRNGFGDFRCGCHGTFSALTGELGQGYADIDAFAFFLGEPAPHAVRFAGADRIVGTFDANVALGTDGFGGTVAAQTCESPLVLGVEEEFWVGFSA